MADRARAVPAHVAVMFGLSVAGYGLGLAAVTLLQSAADRAVGLAREPFARTLEASARRTDALRASFDQSARAGRDVLGAYSDLSGDLDDLHEALAGLTTVVGRVDGEAHALPTSIRLPAITPAAAPRSTTVHATTGGSGAP